MNGVELLVPPATIIKKKSSVRKRGYISGYKKPENLVEQIKHLQRLWPGIGNANENLVKQIEKGEINSPVGAEGFFPIPNLWSKKANTIFGKDYGKAIQKAFDKAEETGKDIHNLVKGKLNEKYLRQSKRTKKFLEQLSKDQGDPEILIVAGQFGMKYRSFPVSRALKLMNKTFNEFGAGLFAIIIMLLTNGKRLVISCDLWIDTPGDEYSPKGDGKFSRSLSLVPGNPGVIILWERDAETHDRFYSSVSFFRPEKLKNVY